MTRHHLKIIHTPSLFHPDTLQTPFKHPPDTLPVSSGWSFTTLKSGTSKVKVVDKVLASKCFRTRIYAFDTKKTVMFCYFKMRRVKLSIFQFFYLAEKIRQDTFNMVLTIKVFTSSNQCKHVWPQPPHAFLINLSISNRRQAYLPDRH